MNINTVKLAEVTFANPVNPPAPLAILSDLEAVPANNAPVTQAGKIDSDTVAYPVFLVQQLGSFDETHDSHVDCGFVRFAPPLVGSSPIRAHRFRRSGPVR